MAYVTTNPPALFASAVGGMSRFWVYKSADPIATVNTANYFTNGGALGLKVGDLMYVWDTVNALGHLVFVNATGNGTTDITDGLAITSTDTD
jgi:hypothetical protein